MVNLVEAQKPLLHFLVRMAGLRQHTVDVDGAGTVITFWVPKDRLPNATVRDVTPGAAAGEATNKLPPRPPAAAKKQDRPAVVLVHGFATEGIVTWQFQVGALAKHYDVYVPDLLYFGGSTSPSADRSPGFQAECLAAALRKLGVGPCTVVGFSYGGFVAFRMAEAQPGLVASVVVTGSLVHMTRSTSEAMLRRLGAASFAELLLPGDVAGLRSLFAAGTHGKWWFPDCVLKDYLKLQDILLLWGENDSIFNMELASSLKEQLGKKAALRSISDAGHLVMLERPCVFNRCLREFLLQQPRTTT